MYVEQMFLFGFSLGAKSLALLAVDGKLHFNGIQFKVKYQAKKKMIQMQESA